MQKGSTAPELRGTHECSPGGRWLFSPSTQLPRMWRVNALPRPTQPGQGLASVLACVCLWNLAQYPLQEVPTLFCADKHVKWALTCPGSGTRDSMFWLLQAQNSQASDL